ncbi:polysaccharide biosynthesis protein [Candidatus Manganitrophus noduliformans]|uniref:NAD-dependent epimerase/dehydratase family protein n=1 Tax=Candidatus Manganitrophus noduliformans TaxID=2606439 RepID=A0A7X6DTW3_9BACT|nr:polysaccharide biosynthesis protein [Candidatus Manganitrophus noduliformans]NKE73162.1 NAD-dependent epimerase/dehydratase family protein [Candidatus Manganitrophus noduliformans]
MLPVHEHALEKKTLIKKKCAKRMFNFGLSLAALILLAPVFILIAIVIKLTSRGPLFFTQERIGKNFAPFLIYKFRTVETLSGDPGQASCHRVTRIGSLLRSCKLDRLPQLINVLKGEMSLVGPRPELQKHVDLFRKDYETILSIRPGMTDFATIEIRDVSLLLSKVDDPEAYYINTVLPKKIKLAKQYVYQRSLALDVKILFTSVMALLLCLPFPFSKKEGAEKKTIKEVIEKYRKGIIIFIHAMAILLSNCFAFLLRFDGKVSPNEINLLIVTLPIVLLMRLFALQYFGLNQGLWRYASIQDLIDLGWAILASSIGIWGGITFLSINGYPQSVILIDAILLFLLLAGFRVTKRVYSVLTQIEIGARRVLIIGAGNAGELVARDMMQNPSYNRQPIAFIDDDPKKISSKIHSIPVMGNSNQLERVVQTLHPDEILIAIPSAGQKQLKGIISRCKSFGIPIKFLPSLTGLLGGKVSITDIRNLDIEDLIGRREIEIYDPQVEFKIKDKRILITGAGGSIGSELCRQVAAFRPELLILFERSENNLHHIQVELLDKFPGISLSVVLGDILDEEKLHQVFSMYRPHVIFHAAAYKHVPMMESHPLGAVQNNILGTYNVIQMADQYGAEDFVLISTDKAVQPTSVMGATKRVAEMLVRYFNQQSKTRLVSVRFGNVLESNGSVVPLFRAQIKKGGPVTVTHPDIKRYFITIQEAVQLVLHAAVLGEGGETFVLDMGDPIKVIDIARTMIILSGFSPDEDIPIQIVGLRPAEKLVEGLFEEAEKVTQTRHEKIRVAQNGKVTDELMSYVKKFASMDHETDPNEIKITLKELIPTYQNDSLPSHASSKTPSAWDDASPNNSLFPAPTRPPSSETPLYH